MDTRMRLIFRDFKRHYHKVTKVIPKLDRAASLTLHITFDGQTLAAATDRPSDEATIRLIVLMRRFLNPSDKLYYKTVWSAIQETFDDDVLTAEKKSKIENLSDGWCGGRCTYRLNKGGVFWLRKRDLQIPGLLNI